MRGASGPGTSELTDLLGNTCSAGEGGFRDAELWMATWMEGTQVWERAQNGFSGVWLQ